MDEPNKNSKHITERQDTASKFRIGEQAAHLDASFATIADQHGVLYQEVKQWREQFLNGSLQRQLDLEKYCESHLKRMRIRFLRIEDAVPRVQNVRASGQRINEFNPTPNKSINK